MANAPKDILRYVGNFLDLRDIIISRLVCKKWKEIIDDYQYDEYLFKRFTLEHNNLPNNKGMYYQSAKNAYVADKSLECLIQMDENVPLHDPFLHSDEGCSMCCILFCLCITCCCCCGCCGYQKTIF